MVLFGLVSLAYAEDPPSPTLPRLAAAHITVDGKAAEPEWASALELGQPVVYQPSADVTPVGSVRTRVLCDGDTLYVHFDVTDPEPRLVRSGLGRRDTRDADDAVGISIDPAGDGRLAYVMFANPVGVQSDALHLPGHRDDDWSWDAVWRSAGHRTATGYEVELAIPWAAVKVSGTVEHIGVLATRIIGRNGHVYAWPAVEPNTEALLYEARLSGPGTLDRHAGLVFLPELTASYPAADTGRLAVAGISPGLTVRYAPDHGLTAVGTFNPDFSQLESDESQIDVNQRYALSYEEKRPFFLEGQDWFENPIYGLVYTRSMNVPLYGVRAAGQIGPVGLAALNALDVAPPPSVNEGGGWTADQLSGHAALASLGRARVGIKGDSYVGLLASDRTVLETGLWNRVLGVDAAARLNEHARIQVAALGSSTTLTEGAAPTFGEDWRVDGLWSGEKLYWLTHFDGVSPGFRQENGFVTSSDVIGGGTEAHENFNTTLEWLPVVTIEPLDVAAYWTWDGAPRQRFYDPSAWVQLGNGAFAKVDGHFATEEFAGTPLSFANTEIYVGTSLGRAVRLDVDATLGTAPFYDADAPRTGRLVSGGVWVDVQPIPELTVSVAPVLAHMDELDGTPIYTAWTGRGKVEVFLRRDVWVRTVAERTGGDEAATWRVEPVAAWELTPGRAVFLGGAFGDDADDETPVWWQAFGKVSWVFNL